MNIMTVIITDHLATHIEASVCLIMIHGKDNSISSINNRICEMQYALFPQHYCMGL